MTDFASALKTAIIDAIDTARADGTVGMSADNLFQVVRAPSASLNGAPRGTNARYYYKEIFNEVVASLSGKYAGFVYSS